MEEVIGKCCNRNQVRLTWSRDGKTIDVGHCPNRVEAPVKSYLPSELLNMTSEQLYSELSKLANINPSNHDFVVNPHMVAGACFPNTRCDFSQNKFETLTLAFGRLCNYNCHFCIVQTPEFTSKEFKENYSPAMDFLLYESFFSKIKNWHLKKLEFTEQGEPLVYFNSIKKYLLEATRDDFESISFTTNGELLTPEIVDFFRSIHTEKGISFEINVSLNYMLESNRKKYLCSNRPFPKLWETLQYISQSDIFEKGNNFVLSSVITAENENEIDYHVELAKQMKFPFMYFLDAPNPNNKAAWERVYRKFNQKDKWLRQEFCEE